MCNLGTDCSDCGVRTFATCLPAMGAACLQQMLGDGHCDEGCNSVHCAHDADDCGANHQIWASKLAQTQSHLAETPPGGVLPLRLHVHIFPITIIIDEATGTTLAKMRIEFNLLWRDERLLDRSTNPALDVWAKSLSLDANQVQRGLSLVGKALGSEKGPLPM